ncbi:MAG: hypothetical protein HY235_14310 [Acidobacteria bacterium]|nr:hypothetical protein [Acidobacteriota bacterium]
MVPLPELGKGGYKNEQGGLYPGGENTPPAAHLKAGLQIARRIGPLNVQGAPSGDGRIVLLTIGMSNTTMESQAFIRHAASDPEINSRLLIVDGAQGGQVAMVTADPQANSWKVADERLKAAGMSCTRT